MRQRVNPFGGGNVAPVSPSAVDYGAPRRSYGTQESPFPDSTVPITPTHNPFTGGWPGSGDPYGDNSAEADAPWAIGVPTHMKGPEGTVWNPTAYANAFYGGLLGGANWLGKYRGSLNLNGGGYEDALGALNNDLRAAMSKRWGKDVPQNLAVYDYNLGNTHGNRQSFQLANWLNTGQGRGYYPGIDRGKDDYNEAAYGLLDQMVNRGGSTA